MPENNFWLVVSNASLWLFFLFWLWRGWEWYKKGRDRKNGDALINAIVEGQITSVEWGVDPSHNPGGLHVARYCVFEGKGWKFLAHEGSSGMKRAPHGFVPHEIRMLIQIPNLKSVLDSVALHFMMHKHLEYSAFFNSAGEGAIKSRSKK